MSDTTSTDTDTAEPAEPVAAAPTLHGCPVTDSRGQVVVHPTRDTYLATVKALVDDGYEVCSDLTAVDYLRMPNRTVAPGIARERFEVVANLLSMTARARIRVRVQVPEGDPTVASLFNLYPGTEAMEREVYDMFGIEFLDHPDLTRILMPEDWDGHPLRKDYDDVRIPVQFSTDFAGNAGTNTRTNPGADS